MAQLDVVAQEATMTRMSSFEVLSAQDISKVVKKVVFKNGTTLTYLPWATAWGIVKQHFPDANYRVYENDMGWDYFSDTRYCWVKVGVTIDGLEHVVKRPVFDQRNAPIPYDSVTASDVNKACMRALCKACAMHGLGLSLWLGQEDMDWEKTDRSAEKQAKVAVKATQLVTPPVKKKVQANQQNVPTPEPTPAPAPVIETMETPPTTEAPAVEVVTETPKAETAEVEPQKKFICNKDGKLWFGQKMFEFKPYTELKLDADPTKAKQQVMDVGNQTMFEVADVAFKAYANQPVFKVFWEMVKTLDTEALETVMKYLSLPLTAEGNLPSFEKLPPNAQVSLTAFAQLANYELHTRKFTYPKG